ncbi:MAG TPA: dephospho-CoA kinase [Planctomycetaceae bacterium]|nr:dephospho-CoA kinase [Planctomycetaceae bacterium]
MSERTHIPVIGIVGGIGSGKSSVARWVAARHQDVTLISGDEIGHEVLTEAAVRDAIRKRFGEPVFHADGQINRRALGQVVFGSSREHHWARDDLERIVHPRIRETIAEKIATAAAAGQRAVLLDAAVLFEAGWNDLCHAVVFIDVPRDERYARLREIRGWDDAETERRESSQASLESKRSRSQFIVDNSGPLEAAGRQLEEILLKMS